MRNAQPTMDDDWVNEAIARDRRDAIARGIAAFVGLVVILLAILYGFTQMAAV